MRGTRAFIDRFNSDVKGHGLEILHDDALYRHLRCSNPAGSCFWFDVVTWPGALAVTGDFGDGYAFRRVDDMLSFFRGNGGRVNLNYWAQKIVAGNGDMLQYSPRMFHEHIWAAVRDANEENGGVPGLAKAVQYSLKNEYDIHNRNEAHAMASDFEHSGFWFEGWETWDVEEWSSSFLWACHGIVWAIQRYDAARAG